MIRVSENTVFVCAEFNLKSSSTHYMRMNTYFRDSNSEGRQKRVSYTEEEGGQPVISWLTECLALQPGENRAGTCDSEECKQLQIYITCLRYILSYTEALAVSVLILVFICLNLSQELTFGITGICKLMANILFQMTCIIILRKYIHVLPTNSFLWPFTADELYCNRKI